MCQLQAFSNFLVYFLKNIFIHWTINRLEFCQLVASSKDEPDVKKKPSSKPAGRSRRTRKASRNSSDSSDDGNDVYAKCSAPSCSQPVGPSLVFF